MTIHLTNKKAEPYARVKTLCGAKEWYDDMTTTKRRKATCAACLKIHGKAIQEKVNAAR